MSDIELVIKIPENIYNLIAKGEDNRDFVYKSDLMRAILEGTPLPKGHGRLMILSEDAVKEELTSLNFSCQKWINESGLWNATLAIIEADKEQEE